VKKVLIASGVAGAVVVASLVGVYNTSVMVESEFKPALEGLDKRTTALTLTSVTYEKGFFGSEAKSTWKTAKGEDFVIKHEVSHSPLSASIRSTPETNPFKGFVTFKDESKPYFIVDTTVSPGGATLHLSIQDMQTVETGNDSGELKGIKGLFKTVDDGIHYSLEMAELNSNAQGNLLSTQGVTLNGVLNEGLRGSAELAIANLKASSPNNSPLEFKDVSLGIKSVDDGGNFAMTFSGGGKSANTKSPADTGFSINETGFDITFATTGTKFIELISAKDEPKEEEILRTFVESSPSIKVSGINLKYDFMGKPQVYSANADFNLTLPKDVDPTMVIAMPAMAINFINGQAEMDVNRMAASALTAPMGLNGLMEQAPKSEKNADNVKIKLVVANGKVLLNDTPII
jgi:hypothetical protein